MKKEKIGWTRGNRHYRLKNKRLVSLFYLMDRIGDLLFGFFVKRDPKKSPQNILVVRLDHIGDMVLTSSFIVNLRKNHPESKISILCRGSVKPVAELIEGLDDIIVLNSPWFSRNESGGWFRALRFCFRNFREFDLVFDLHSDPRNIILSWLVGKYRVGYGIRGLGFLLSREVHWDNSMAKHVVERNLDLLRALGMKIYERETGLRTDGKAESRVRSILKQHGLRGNDFIVIQMGSGSEAREWPIDSWVSLVSKLVKGTAVVTADTDREKVRYLKGKVKSRNFVSLSLSLKEYAALISLCKSIISVESLGIHVGCSFGKNVIDLHSGTTLSEEWGPYCKKSTVFQDKSCGYYPCGLESCVYGKSRCMQKLSADEVLTVMAGLKG